jgi:protein-tyrosine-phosphatase/predicted ATP-grasp superfamily ATP-dependent carboligase
MKKVLILGHGTRSFLSVIRSLGRKGIMVHAANSLPEDLALYSKYVAKYFLLPPYSEPDRWKSEVNSIVEKEHYDLVIPTDDSPIILLQQIRSEIEKHSSVYLLDAYSFTITNDKLKTYSFCKSLGIRVPGYSTLSKDDDPGKILKKYNFPLILKPVSSFSVDNLEKKNLVKIARNTDEFITILKTLLLHNPRVIVQEYFEGAGMGVEILAFRGEILAAFQHIRIHEKRIWGIRNIGGASTYRRSQPVDPFLIDQAQKIIRGMNYTGVAMLEFRKNFEKNESVLIEINGRFWGSLPLAVAAGADFPYYLYQLLVENQKTFPQKFNDNLFCRSTTEDLYWIFDEIASCKSDVKIQAKFIGKMIGEFFNIFLLRERNDTMVLDDLKPGIMEIASLVFHPVSILKRRMRRNVHPSKTRRKIRSEQFKHVISHAKKILFVCRGNICRSPFAEKYSRTIFPENIHIFSCGYIQQDGRESPPEAISTAKKFGIDLSDHRALHITEEMMQNSDLVIVFDESNLRMLLEKFPQNKSKIWFLSEICTDIPIDIEDPFRKDCEMYEKVYSEIACCIDKINQGLSK